MLTQSSGCHQTNLFGTVLLIQLDPNDPLFHLAAVIPWKNFDKEFMASWLSQIYFWRNKFDHSSS